MQKSLNFSSDKGNPTLDTLMRVMKAQGLRLAITASSGSVFHTPLATK
jgi:DNA-binding phage protein